LITNSDNEERYDRWISLIKNKIKKYSFLQNRIKHLVKKSRTPSQVRKPRTPDTENREHPA